MHNENEKRETINKSINYKKNGRMLNKLTWDL